MKVKLLHDLQAQRFVFPDVFKEEDREKLKQEFKYTITFLKTELYDEYVFLRDAGVWMLGNPPLFLSAKRFQEEHGKMLRREMTRVFEKYLRERGIRVADGGVDGGFVVGDKNITIVSLHPDFLPIGIDARFYSLNDHCDCIVSFLPDGKVFWNQSSMRSLANYIAKYSFEEYAMLFYSEASHLRRDLEEMDYTLIIFEDEDYVNSYLGCVASGNLLCVNGKVILSDGRGKVVKLLEREGYDVIQVTKSWEGEGGVRCLSQIMV